MPKYRYYTDTVVHSNVQVHPRCREFLQTTVVVISNSCHALIYGIVGQVALDYTRSGDLALTVDDLDIGLELRSTAARLWVIS